MSSLPNKNLTLNASWIKRVERWVEGNKAPETGDINLHRKRIYILPSRPGITFLMLVALMGVTSINYKLSLGYLMVFLLAGVAWVSMFQTFGNLHRLILIPGKADPVFAGELAPISLTLKNPTKHLRYSVRLVAPEFVKQALVDLAPESERTLRFALRTNQRGWLPMPKMTIDTTFPIGVWRSWARWQPNLPVLVYPEPEAIGTPLPETLASGGESLGKTSGNDDLAGIRNYVEGDSPRTIAWSAMARSTSDQMLSKQFDGGVSGELSLDWAQTSASLGTEGRISRLTRWVIDADQAGMRYRLTIPGTSIEVDSGPNHRVNCLRALALLEI